MNEIEVSALRWTRENVRHVRRHGGSVAAVEAVLLNAPRYFAKVEQGIRPST